MEKIAVIGRNFTHDIIKGINERFPEDDVIIVDKDIPKWEDKLKGIEDGNKYYLKEKQQMSRMAAMAEMMALTLMAAPMPYSPSMDISDTGAPKKVSKYLRRGTPMMYGGTPRNSPCPCGSGLKYKKCCINKPQSPEDGRT